MNTGEASKHTPGVIEPEISTTSEPNRKPFTSRPIAPPSGPVRSSLLKPATTFPSANSTQRVSGGLSVPGAQSRRKVVLKPGHSPLDWAEKNSKIPSHVLRGVPPNTPPPQFVRVSKEELKEHKSLDDCWTSINGKVFNITPYVDFHPGGVDEIMKCAGRDGTALFNKYHSWVNADRMLQNCMIGIIKN